MEVLTRNLVKPNAYFDSVALMRVAATLSARPEVAAASLMMGTPANLELLEEAGLLSAEGRVAGPNDLVIAVRAEEGLLDTAHSLHIGARGPVYMPEVFEHTRQHGYRLVSGVDLMARGIPSVLEEVHATLAGRSVNTPSSSKASSKNAKTGIDSNLP